MYDDLGERAATPALFEPHAGTSLWRRPVSRWAVWQCPHCGHEEQQLAVAMAVGHRCKRVRRIVELVREPERVGGGQRGR